MSSYQQVQRLWTSARHENSVRGLCRTVLAVALITASSSWAFAAISLSSASGSSAASLLASRERPDFNRDVRPILAEHCFACHGPDAAERKADLRLDTAEGIARKTASGAITKAGDSQASELMRRMAASDPEDRMPPPGHGLGLSDDELAVVEAWIDGGAEWKAHWSYAPFRTVALPTISNPTQAHNPIDSFVLARLEARGESLSSPADARSLLRRATLDLIGMPPTPDELEAFITDTSADAFEHAVDRLLQSPHYAERWARHWLDLARYADSHGFTIDGGRTMWPYRDWVVNAINQGMPFDQFTIEQLAGDLLPSATNAQRIATGFHRNTQINQEGGAKDEENRVKAVFDRVDTTATVWLGSTMACARCHDHKFDPVTQREYFSMFAVFDQTGDAGVSTGPTVFVTDDKTAPIVAAFRDEERRLRSELHAAEAEAREGWQVWTPAKATGSNGPELRIETDDSIRSIGQNPQTSTYVLDGPAPRQGIRALRIEALPHASLRGKGPGRTGSGNFVLERVQLYARPLGSDARFVELRLVHASASYSQGEGPEGGSQYPVAGALSDIPKTGWAIQPRFGEAHVAHFELHDELPSAAWEVRIELHQGWGSNHVLGRFRICFDRAGEDAHPATVPDRWKNAWLASVDHAATRPRLTSSMVMEQRERPRATRRMNRGDFRDPAEVVSAGVPASMNHFGGVGAAAGRLELAQWLTDPRNALVHRVTVNRWWQRFFGTGLVATDGDFGLRGGLPSHPDLLEWLAAQLVEQEFSMRAIHRLIVTSRTYRQSARAPRAELDDPHNRMLARQNRLRIDAESIRDSALRASGLLNTKMGGPPVQPPQPEGVFMFTQARKSWKADVGDNRFRRSLYTRIWRSSTYPFHVTFDAPVANVTCTHRGRSNTPLQALTLANDPMILELAAGLGERVRASRETDEERIQLAFELCTSRLPEQAELEILIAHLESGRARLRQADLDTIEVEQRAWTAVARVLFNLDEFLTRE
ncbi:MAG: cytochrome c553 [Planctomycetota bacterium]|jgi:cytochrome c553